MPREEHGSEEGTIVAGNSTRKIKELTEPEVSLAGYLGRNPEMNSSDHDRDYVAMSRYTQPKVSPCGVGDQYHAVGTTQRATNR